MNDEKKTDLAGTLLRSPFIHFGKLLGKSVYIFTATSFSLLHLPSSQLSNFTSKHDKGLPARPFEWSHSGKKDLRHNKICNYPTRKASLIKYLPPNIPNASNLLILYNSRPFQMTCIWLNVYTDSLIILLYPCVTFQIFLKCKRFNITLGNLKVIILISDWAYQRYKREKRSRSTLLVTF